MSTIPSYPPPSANLVETDLVLGWQAGATRRIPISVIVTFLVTTNPGGYTTVAGALSALSGSGGIAYDPATGIAKLANMAAGTIKGNAGTGSAAPSDLNASQVAGMVQPSLIANAMGSSMTVAPSQAAISAALTAILTGQTAFTLPDVANGDTIPAPGSKKPYLDAGVLKIA